MNRDFLNTYKKGFLLGLEHLEYIMSKDKVTGIKIEVIVNDEIVMTQRPQLEHHGGYTLAELAEHALEDHEKSLGKRTKVKYLRVIK